MGAAERLAVALPPAALPLVHAGRIRKRWRYVGVYGPELSLCVGLVRVGPVRQSFWAVWDRAGGRLHERTRRRDAGVLLPPGRVHVTDRGLAVDLVLDEAAVPGVETVTPYGPAYAWTAKRAGVPVRGTVRLDGVLHRIDGLGVVDDSAGYPPRHTDWRWSAGVGEDDRGRTVGWNLVDGIHDDPAASERTVWIDGEPRHAGPVRFADDLSGVRDAGGATADAERGTDLHFASEAVRSRRDEALVARSSYEQPFGTFSGVLPGGVRLRTGFGVMERHSATW